MTTLLGFSVIQEQEAFAADRNITELTTILADETIEANEDWFITDDATVFIGTNVEVTVKGEIKIDWGTLNVMPGAKIVTDEGHIHNGPAGILNNDGIIFSNTNNDGGFGNDGTINNGGVLSFWGGSARAVFNDGTINNADDGTINVNNIRFSNRGAIENNGGTIRIDNIINNIFDGSINNSNNGKIYNRGEIDNQAVINNFWGFIHNFDGGEINNRGDIVNYSHININNLGKVTNIFSNDNNENNDGLIHNDDSNGVVAITSGGTLENQNGAVIANNGNIHEWCDSTLIGTIPTSGNSVDDKCSFDGEKKAVLATHTGMLSDGTKMMMSVSPPKTGEMINVIVEFEGSKHVNYDLKVTQGDDTVIDETDVYSQDGKKSHRTELSSSAPVNVTVTFQGYGVDDPKTGPIGEEVTFSNVVPEFGTIAMMILTVAIMSIIAVTAKSRVIPRL